MPTIYLQFIRDRLTALYIYAGSALLLLWMYTGMYPNFAKQSDSMNQLLETMPSSIKQAFGIDNSYMSTVGGFLCAEQFSFVWPIIVMFMAVSFANGAVVSEIESGTIELTLAQPISRLRLILSRYLAGLSTLLGFCVISILAIKPLAMLYTVSIDFHNVLVMTLLGFLFSWVIYSLGFLLSAFFSEKGKASFTLAGLLVFMYVLNIVSSLKESLHDLKYLSFFYYFAPNPALVHGHIMTSTVWVFSVVSLISTIIAFYWFTRRDIAA